MDRNGAACGGEMWEDVELIDDWELLEELLEPLSERDRKLVMYVVQKLCGKDSRSSVENKPAAVVDTSDKSVEQAHDVIQKLLDTPMPAVDDRDTGKKGVVWSGTIR